MQAITAAASIGTSLKYLSPAKMRSALRSAGNIVKEAEIAEVLSYVITDKNYPELHDLHLILLKNGSIKKIQWHRPGSNKYAVFADSTSQQIYNLMAANKHQLVEPSLAWTELAR